ncbi:hypothetical protein NUV89_26670 [Pseudomonas sp. 18.1.10]|uniref:hypothetical protein n=1 Tax=Pseudomonas sp. 18.1.10 TaxID=2969302 RepID=UPI00214F68DB|nr:hypothetical protein [Pseudomonas sp. 18.1.10]MCR4541990.1 hypothetical protein [Pseudomonas sp. 18.1.10]
MNIEVSPFPGDKLTADMSAPGFPAKFVAHELFDFAYVTTAMYVNQPPRTVSFSIYLPRPLSTGTYPIGGEKGVEVELGLKSDIYWSYAKAHQGSITVSQYGPNFLLVASFNFSVTVTPFEGTPITFSFTNGAISMVFLHGKGLLKKLENAFLQQKPTP